MNITKNKSALKTVNSSIGLTIILLVFSLMLNLRAYARENIAGYSERVSGVSYKTLAAGCAPATAQTDLDINNVRTKILNGGDMWWDPGITTAKYEIPKGSGKNSLFAGALWIGGVDAGGSLKVAAMTYRQTGNDFFPGPVNTSTVSTSASECNRYNKHWKITRQEVADYIANGYQNPSDAIKSWPGNGSNGADQFLAPFYDANGDGIYRLEDKDYPYYRMPNQTTPATGPCATCTGTLFGDQTLWWVFNDIGNIHSESSSQPIGLEVQAQAFAFATNDEINNMTFYQYKIINRSTFQLNNTYFGQWVDPDLGNFNDDFVGCDVSRGLGYCYNGDADDDGASGYGANPPAIGIDFFQGPLADLSDGVDNNRNGITDESCEQIIMSKFVYYNNDYTVRGNPTTSTHYYNYLRGLWNDGTPMTYGGNGYNTGTPCNFMFPDNTDPNNPVSWTEANSGNTPADRRFLQSAGQFTLKPGAVNYITVGAVWAKASQGGPGASVNLLKLADDKAQALFNNCFKVLDGPDAPDLSIREIDKQLILSWDNGKGSNNYLEAYNEIDPTIVKSSNNKYKFQGYQVFQLKDNTVNASDIHNPDKARLLTQCDIADSVSQLVNFYFDASLNANIPVQEVQGENKGIRHSILVKQDLFATGNSELVNHKPYYYTIISYAYNRYAPYDPSNPDTVVYGQKKPYFAGRNNIKTYSGIPHISSPENGGQELKSTYGMGPKIQRIEGEGNGGLVVDLTPETINEIMTSSTYQSLNPIYENGRGPVSIKVYDPVKVPKGNFRLFIDTINSVVSTKSKWRLYSVDLNDSARSNQTIAVGVEQIIAKWGLSISIGQVKSPGAESASGNGFLESSKVFTDSNHPWLGGVKDEDGNSDFNWIRSGKYTSTSAQYNDYNYTLNSNGKVSGKGLDDGEYYEKMVNGTWAPFILTSKYELGPGYGASFPSTSLSLLSGVDVVFTSDKSKWTRCPVIETNDNAALTEGNAVKFSLRRHTSVNKEGIAESDQGKGWFPGYAINVETGERLNIIFGEDSWLSIENGRDMIWNPTGNLKSSIGVPHPNGEVNYEPLLGGKHFVYIMSTKYDEGAAYYAKLATNKSFDRVTVFKDAMWVTIPLLEKNETLLSNDVKVRLRVSKPYKQYATASPSINGNNPVYYFNTNDLYNDKNNKQIAKKSLDLVNIVPNPYYAYSAYEKNQLDNRIKITNLPSKCKISIYTVNGTLVRKFNRDFKDADYSDGRPVSEVNLETSLEWDLKNTAGIPISSGLYLIHIEAEGLGEKVLKWVGVMRPIDLDTF